MLTHSHLAALHTMAGNDLSWDNTPTHRLSSDARAGLSAYLTNAQCSICAFCGEANAYLEACHIIPGGRARKGWTAGNIAMGCRECNEIDSDSVISISTILRSDLIITQWPSIPELARLGRKAKKEREEALLSKKQMRGM